MLISLIKFRSLTSLAHRVLTAYDIVDLIPSQLATKRRNLILRLWDQEQPRRKYYLRALQLSHGTTGSSSRVVTRQILGDGIHSTQNLSWPGRGSPLCLIQS
jgi:hypothetical protein